MAGSIDLSMRYYPPVFSMFYTFFSGASPKSVELTPRWLVRLRLALALMAGLGSPAPWAAEVAAAQGARLGTLFYSVAERQNIVRARAGDEPGDSPEAAQEISVNGIVKRQGKNSTAWVNGQPVREGEAFTPAQPLTITPGGIQLDGKNVKVGEKLDLVTRERTDVVPPGALTTRGTR